VPTKEEIIAALKQVKDPEVGLSIIDLGLVYDVSIDVDGKVQIKMTLTTPACPYGKILIAQAHSATSQVGGVREVDVKLVWDPPWNPKEMCSDLAKDILNIW